MSQINTLGPVGFNPTGEYDNTHKYERLDVVYYEGSSYVALQDSIGQLPTNTEYWDCIAVGYLKQNTYDSVADMKADNTLKNGMYAQTVGYYEPNDGGGASYIIKTETTRINETLNNNLHAELIFEEPKKINVLQLGIKRNVDEDQSTKVQGLLNLNPKYILYFPSGYYYFTSGLLNNKRHDIIGVCNTYSDWDENLDNTRFKFVNVANDSTLIDIRGGRATIKDIYVICDAYELTLDKSLISNGTEAVDIFTESENRTGITGISLENFGCNLERVSVQGCNYGFNVKGYNIVTNCGALECKAGFICDNDNVFTALNIQRCYIGVTINGNLNNFINTRMDSIKTYGFNLKPGSHGNNFNNCLADFCQYGVFKLDNSNNNYIAGSIGRSGTYYAGFTKNNVNEPEKACKIYLKNSKYNRIDITDLYQNALDTSSEIVYAPTFEIVGEGLSYHNDITLTGKIDNSNLTENTILTIDEIDTMYHPFNGGGISGTVKYLDFIYSIINAFALSAQNVRTIKSVGYNSMPVVRNTTNNTINVSGILNNTNELRVGNETNGWISITKTSDNKCKIQYLDTTYNYHDVEITGVTNV